MTLHLSENKRDNFGDWPCAVVCQSDPLVARGSRFPQYSTIFQQFALVFGGRNGAAISPVGLP
jgi:hypothetical protein